jgi:hypothetical protein
VEGWIVDYPEAAKLNCKTCTYNAAKVRQPFAWIPE